MKKSIRIFASISILHFVASFATCYFGVNYSESQIPPEVRNKMTDTDWIGVEWISRGLVIMLLAIVSAIVATRIWLYQKKLR